MTTEIRVIVTVEYRDGRIDYRTWRTTHPSGAAAFKRRIRQHYARRAVT